MDTACADSECREEHIVVRFQPSLSYFILQSIKWRPVFKFGIAQKQRACDAPSLSTAVRQAMMMYFWYRRIQQANMRAVWVLFQARTTREQLWW